MRVCLVGSALHADPESVIRRRGVGQRRTSSRARTNLKRHENSRARLRNLRRELFRLRTGLEETDEGILAHRERRQEEIAKVQAELKSVAFLPMVLRKARKLTLGVASIRKMTGKAGSDDESGKSKKPKRTGPSLLQLEREKYMRGGAMSRGGKGKRKAGAADDDDSVLDALEDFRSKLFEAAKTAPKELEEDEAAAGDRPEKLHGIDLNDDELDEDVRAGVV